MEKCDQNYKTICITCLSSDRHLTSLAGMPSIYQIYRKLLQETTVEQFANPLNDTDIMLCWECLASLKRFSRFKRQVHSAQEQLKYTNIKVEENLDPLSPSRSLSRLAVTLKMNYDILLKETPALPAVSIKTEHETTTPHIEMINCGPTVEVEITPNPSFVKIEQTTQSQISLCPQMNAESAVKTKSAHDKRRESKLAYTMTTMTEEEMAVSREQERNKPQFVNSAYKCELCLIEFVAEFQMEEHFESAHQAKPNHTCCRICSSYIDSKDLNLHIEGHYTRYTCKICEEHAYSGLAMTNHVKDKHFTARADKPVVAMHQLIPDPHLPAIQDNRGIHQITPKKHLKPPVKPFKLNPVPLSALSIKVAEPEDLRKLRAKRVIEGYQCLECDMFFRNPRARRTHVLRYHKPGMQCDICKKTYVHRLSLIQHLQVHEGPLPKEECPICHKMVRSVRIRQHIRMHQSKTRYECKECNKSFKHVSTFRSHLKRSLAHANDSFRFPCPVCGKLYFSRQKMQDHFNYQHLSKTTHKCRICDKPMATKECVERHMKRVHGEREARPRNYVCEQCGRAFQDSKSLAQHVVIHSGERPLSCDVCQQTFKQKSALYTHKKRVHKIFPPKKEVQFINK